MPETNLLDGFRSSLWNSAPCDAPDTQSLTESKNCDVVIIGAGVTGLNAALNLASNGVDVAVLEAGELGIGSSGRSGGQVNIGLNEGPSQLIQRFGAEKGLPLINAVADAPDYVFDLIRTHNMQCEPVQNGWVQAAVKPRYLQLQQELLADYAKYGVELELLDQPELQARTGASSYVGGLYYGRAGSIHPLSYTYELARVAIQKGANVFTNTKATQFKKLKCGWQVDTPDGQINCNTVLLCTNAYTDGLAKGLKQTVVPVRTILTASEPLPANMRETILPKQVTFVDKRRLILYFRYGADGRLCVGDHGPARDEFKMSDFIGLKKRAIAVFPALADVRWDFHWGGRVAMTKDSLPFMHELAPGLIAAMGYNGRGIAMGSKMGELLAMHVLADARNDAYGDAQNNAYSNSQNAKKKNEQAFPLTKPDRFKMHAFHNIGVATAIKWYTVRDYLEQL